MKQTQAHTMEQGRKDGAKKGLGNVLHQNRFSHPQLIIFVLVFALIGGYLLFKSLATSPLVTSIEAEQMSLPAGGSIITDSTASGGKAVQLTAAGTSHGTINFPSTVTSVTVNARASQCNGSPTMAVAIGSVTYLTSSVGSTSWASFSFNQTFSSGTHDLYITASNLNGSTGHGKKKTSCPRTLYVDVTNFYGPAVITPPPTVSLSVSPTAVTTGQSATLTWASTNSTSCSASGAWSGSEPTSGSVSTGALNQNSTYTLTCTGAGGSASASTTVTVSSSTATGPTFGAADIYSSSSTWNKPIPTSPPIAPDSNTMITSYETGYYGEPVGWGPIPGYAYSTWLGPRQNAGRTWVTIASTPNVTYSLDYPSCGYQILQIPIPSNLVYHQDNNSSDFEHRTVLQLDDGSTWNLSHITPPNTTTITGCPSNSYWHGNVAEHRTGTTGWTGLGDGYQSNGTAWGAGSADKTPYDAGLITALDMQNAPAGGHLNHALNVNISSSADGNTAGHPKFVYPGGGGDGRTTGTLGIPLGARIQLDPSLTDAQLQSLGLTKSWQLILAHTMQIYGLIATDTAAGQGDGDGVLAQYPQQAPNYTFPWVADGSGWSYGNSFPTAIMTHFRVIDWTQWTGR